MTVVIFFKIMNEPKDDAGVDRMENNFHINSSFYTLTFNVRHVKINAVRDMTLGIIHKGSKFETFGRLYELYLA